MLSPSTAEVCESLRKLTSSKTEWTWNSTYQMLFYQAKPILKEDTWIKILWQNPATVCRDGCVWSRTGNCHTTDQKWYKLPNCLCKQETVMYRKKIRQYWKVSITTDRKPLVAIFKRDVAMLSQSIQWLLFRIHQYRIRTIYQHGPDFPEKNTRKANMLNYLACSWILVPYKQLLIHQIAWQYMSCSRQHYNMSTFSASKEILFKAGQGTQMKYHKTWEDSGHFEMPWQWLMGLF